MSTEPLLSVLVPTWKRRRHLEELLGILLPALEGLPRVNLLVSNNGSPDDTRGYLESLPAHPQLRIVNHAVNSGQVIHLGWVYAQARGRFLWLIGDDDRVAADALAWVVATLEAHPELGWIHLPHEYAPAEGEPIRSHCPAAAEWFARGREAFPRYVNWLSFCSSNIVRTELLQARLPFLQYGTDFWPMGLLMEAVAEAPALVACRSLVKAGVETTWGEKWVRVTHFEFPEEILKSRVLTRHEKRLCLRQRYADAPNALERLVLLNRRLLARLIWRDPVLLGRLVSPRALRKVFRGSVWRKVGAYHTGGAERANDLFH
ncbi:MAG TPA: glycosyltransferase family 2 protein [Verrucomicrobiota bacterium]|nr:glycosyltransferase family 2 protein [Verrucomicrobiota bacterium]HNU52022.1 glycosyltransferase family 2 protein [Verrucomicrobiota bacterium]